MARGNYIPEPYASNLREAFAKGEKTYLGRPCKKGHDLRYTNKGNCVPCALDRYARKRALVAARNKFNHVNDPRKRMLASAKSRAKEYGRDFDLELDDIVIPDVCPVFGTDMDQPSLDRVDNSKGYTKDNIRVISFRANTIKSDATIEELEAVLAYMKAA